METKINSQDNTEQGETVQGETVQGETVQGETVDHRLKHQFCMHTAEAINTLLTLHLPRKDTIDIYTRLNYALDKMLDYEEDENSICDCDSDNPEQDECTESLTLASAVSLLSDGHGIILPRRAREICKLIGVEYTTKLQSHYYSNWEDPKGVKMIEGKEGSVCVSVLALGGYIADQLGVIDKAEGKLGRGFQAREYSHVIAEELRRQQKLPEKEHVE